MKILLVNQSSFISTGYGIMGKEFLTRASKEYEVAELACDTHHNHPMISQVPWKVYPNLPLDNEKQEYESNRVNTYGRWKFEKICLEFKPTHVISWRDNWMDSFIGRSPLKKCYNWIYMPTIDAPGQDKEWLHDYTLADSLITYQNWSKNQLDLESGGRINTKVGSIGSYMHPLSNRLELKEKLGLGGVVIGTVMRNQGRKRFPELFRAFKRILEKHPNTILYCHTSHPDMDGWNIPRYLLEYNIQNNVVFTMYCQNCQDTWPSRYKGKLSHCPNCKQKSAVMSTAAKSLTNEQMNIMYNLFDIYVQFSNCEGFSIPILESSMAGTPVLYTDYSAMVDVGKRCGGKPLNINCDYREPHSERWFAAPSEDNLVSEINRFINMNEEEKQQWRKSSHEKASAEFSWDKFYQTIKGEITGLKPRSYDCPPDIKNPQPFPSFKMTNSQFVRWCIENVLYEPEKINTYFEARILEELESTVRHTGTSFININPKLIYDEMCKIRNYTNMLESYRCQKSST